MFDKKTKESEFLGKTNRIVEGTIIQGNISAVSDTRIDGTLIGDFETKGKLVIGVSGTVKGNIICKNCDIEGVFEGKLKISELLNVKATAKIKAEVVCGKLAVEPGATLNGTCTMSNANYATTEKAK